MEKTNMAYAAAKEQEKKANEKVNEVLSRADGLIDKAKGAGGNKADSHSFLWFEWVSKGDEIETMKANLKEMVECGIETAEAQKNLVEVQSALANSQTALLSVQEAQLAYHHQIGDATKFLYGLSAYNISSVQSVLINLQAVLSGASKEKLGEMAQQQLLFALDQLKDQQNTISRFRENEALIDGLSKGLSSQNDRIENNNLKDSEQDKRIDSIEKTISTNVEKIDRLKEEIEKFKNKKTSKHMAIITFVIAITALILVAIQLLLSIFL